MDLNGPPNNFRQFWTLDQILRPFLCYEFAGKIAALESLEIQSIKCIVI